MSTGGVDLRDGAGERARPSDGFAYRVLTATGIAVLVVVLLLLLWRAADALLLAFVGVLLATFLGAASDWLSAHTPLPRGLALAVVVVTILGGAAFAGWLLAPEVADQVDQLARELPRALGELRLRIERYGWVQGAVADAQAQLTRGIPVLFSTALSALGSLAIAVVVGLFVAAEPGLYRSGLVRLFPVPARPRAREVLGTLGHTLRWWLVGRLFAMSVVGGMTAAGLWLLGLPLALTLGLLAALLNFIPYVGPILSAVPALLLALLEGPSTVLYVGLLYWGIQTVESYVLTPLVQKEAVSLPPALTLVTQVLGGLLLGFLGFVLASPLTAVAMVLVRMLYVEDVLGDRPARAQDAQAEPSPGELVVAGRAGER